MGVLLEATLVKVADTSSKYQSDFEDTNGSRQRRASLADTIPEDWDWISIKMLLAGGATIKTGPFGTVLKAHEYSHEGVPIISVGEIGSGSLHVTESTPRAPTAVVRRLPEYLLKSGDIVFGRKGAVDRSALVVATQGGWFLGSDGIRLRLPASVDASYVAHQLQRESVKRWLLANAVGTTMASLNGAVLETVRFPLAPHADQRAIAQALSDVDELLGTLDSLIAKKRAIKKAATQQLLTGKIRLPGFTGEWKQVPLGEIGRFLKGNGVKRENSQSGTLACVRYGEIYTTHDDYIRVFESWISREVAATATRLQCGDLLFAASGETKEEIGKCVAIVTETEAYAGGDIIVLRPNAAHALFLGYALNAPPVVRQKASFGQGDAVVHIRATALARVVILMPDLQEQMAIAAVLFDIDTEIAALEARSNKTRDVKQGMMQQLLTGRIRLVKPSPERTAA